MLGSTLLAKLLPDGVRGRWDHRRGHHQTFYPWGGPMNGQTARLELCRQILTQIGVSHIVETGTYRGTTTEWLAQFGRPVVTFEADERYARFSRLRLQKYPNVRLVHTNSVDGLRALLQEEHVRSGVVFYYLDAHWEDYLPLADELRIIADQTPHAIVLIDDFAVAGDPEYQFDDYGQRGALNLDYLTSHGFGDLLCFFPTTPARAETGVARGYVVATADHAIAASLQQLPHLRKHPAGSSTRSRA